MAIAHEQDVVIAFRQAVEDELRQVQEGQPGTQPVLLVGNSLEDNLVRLAESHAKLQHEVALLRTIILKLVSDPVEIPGDPALPNVEGGGQTQG